MNAEELSNRLAMS